MIFSIITGIASVIGIVGFFCDIPALFIIGGVLYLIETVIGLITGELHSLATTVITTVISVVVSLICKYNIFYGWCFGLCIECAIFFLLSIPMMVAFFSKALKSRETVEQSNGTVSHQRARKFPVVLSIIFSITTIISVAFNVVGFIYYRTETAAIANQLASTELMRDGYMKMYNNSQETLAEQKLLIESYEDNNITYSEWFTVWSNTVEGREIARAAIKQKLYEQTGSDSSTGATADEWSAYIHNLYYSQIGITNSDK